MALHLLVPQTTFSATVKRRVFTSGRRGSRGLLTVLRRRTSIKRHRGSQPPVVKTSITLSSVPLVNKFANSILNPLASLPPVPTTSQPSAVLHETFGCHAKLLDCGTSPHVPAMARYPPWVFGCGKIIFSCKIKRKMRVLQEYTPEA